MIFLTITSRDKTLRRKIMCHSVIVLVILVSYMCRYVTCDADAEPDPDPNADPDALWDKLPALQKYHAAGKVLSLNPKQSFISPTQGITIFKTKIHY